MKKLYPLLLVVLYYNCTHAQIEPLLYDVQWYLYEMKVNETIYHPPTNDELTSVPLTFSEVSDHFTTSVCNSLFGDIEAVDPFTSFQFLNGLNQTLIECNNPVNSIFEGVYFNFFLDNLLETFTYSIIIVDNNDEGLYLTLNLPNGDYAEYADKVLGVQDFIGKQKIVYPNPFQNTLYVKSENDQEEFLDIEIISALGQTVFKETYINHAITKLELENLSEGIYYLILSEESGVQQIIHLIKKNYE
ncbi:T9SS type A sorting domain-containing protein [Altibacter lentus]|uniref:T9SS type A sorting domain-containing protein n=1 Tax=Altibacter lentus TaxID=1223410 RepID=UPI0005567D91|nr:T9SS type A sorting domain-containing protein [Altibacter lentus]